ncbi:MAG: thymidylate kinase [Dysgonamonadaceae bacterium]|nr:thymidylate kinase [Dysgonamonadaceae bacterium]
MKGKLLVIEGLDGSGKSTQIELLKKKLDASGIQCRYIHFPMLNRGRYGELVAEFLRGEYGALHEVHPKLVALLFANDRKEHVETINHWLSRDYVVLADRYVNSNIAFQCAKIDDEAGKEKLKQWILDFEFGYNQLPLPSQSFFLDVPFDHVARSLSDTRKGDDRSYLNGKVDIHEASLLLQKQVYNEYQKMIREQPDFTAIPCFDEKGKLLRPEVIHGRIFDSVAGV